ncbi:ubiquitin C-terminal hydrolase Ubp14 [Glugoides intestinalis]
MVDLSKFSGKCSYCYKGIENGLAVCTCGNALCEDHQELHLSKFGCSIHYTLSKDTDDRVRVKVETKEEASDLEERINIKVKNGMVGYGQSKECTHIYNSSNVKKTIDMKTIKCSECDIVENLWICIECGYIGCGREQQGMKGKGHAIAHFKHTKNVEESHSNVILLQSIENGVGDTFCYTCDDFIQNPLKLQITVINNEKATFKDISGETPKVSIKSNILGIVNEGQNCYISAGLHLLGEAFREYILTDHFFLCETNPLSCLCCQLIKVFDEMKLVEKEIRSVRIVELLDCIFTQMTCFTRNRQEDCAEFLQMILSLVNTFEDCMLLPRITNQFDFEMETSTKCEKCEKGNKESTKSNILYSPFVESIEGSVKSKFKQVESTCECGSTKVASSSITKLSQFIIINIIRFDKNYKKDQRLIDTSSFEVEFAVPVILENHGEVKSAKFEVVGCICHKGNETTNGHYIWWVQHGNKMFIADNSIVTKGKVEDPKNGTIFLMKVKEGSYK